MNTIDKRKAYVIERMRERSKFPNYKHNPCRGLYHHTEWKHVVSDWEDSAVAVLWERLADAGLVRLIWRPDMDTPYEDLLDTAFETHGHLHSAGGERELRAWDRAQKETLERDGAWGLVGEYRLQPCERCPSWYSEECDHRGWRHGDSVWGFVGADDLGYELGIQAQTITSLTCDLKARRPAT